MKKVMKYVVVFALCFFVVNAITVKAENNATIPIEAAEWNGQRYMYYDNNYASWDEAKWFCESLGGHLATITSEEENSFLYSYITSLGYESAYFGLTDAQHEGEWKWVTGEPFLYGNWHSGEPSNSYTSENYAMFYWKFPDGTWNDGNFGNGTLEDGRGFICEWDHWSGQEYKSLFDKLLGTYEGTYIATQGVTGLSLTIYKEDNQYKASFYFYPTNESPNVESGKFLMNITFDYYNGLFYFEGVEWIERAKTYKMANLLGNLVGDDFLFGEVYNQKTLVGNFSLDRKAESRIKLPSEEIYLAVSNDTMIQAIIYEGDSIKNIEEKIAWSISDTSVAELSKKSTTGVNAIDLKAIQDGTVTVTAALLNGNSTSCKVIVGTGIKVHSYFEKKGINYYYTGEPLMEGTYLVPGNLIIDKPMKLPKGQCSIECQNITIKAEVELSKSSKLSSNKDFKIKSNGILDLSAGGIIFSKGNVSVSGNGILRNMDKSSNIEAQRDFTYHSSVSCNVDNGLIVVGRNINLTKNFKSLKENIVKLEDKKKHIIKGGKTCTIENLDLSSCDMGQISLNGKCSVKNINFPIVTTKSHESVRDLFILNPIGKKNNEILNNTIASVLYSIACDKSIKKDLLKNIFNEGSFDGIATYTSEKFSIPVIIKNENGKYEKGIVSGNLTGFGELGYGTVKYQSSKRKYEVIHSHSKKISDKVVKKFLDGVQKGAGKEIKSIAKDCLISYMLSGLSDIFDVVEFRKGTISCKLAEGKMLLDDFDKTFKYLAEY